jgi:hypothetical protein
LPEAKTIKNLVAIRTGLREIVQRAKKWECKRTLTDAALFMLLASADRLFLFKVHEASP